MKSSPSSPATQTKILKIVVGCFCAFCSTSSLFALTPTTGEEFHNIYSQAREQEEKMGAQYMADALKGFSVKLNKAIKKDVELKKFFGKGYCDGCESVVSPELDQVLIEYLSTVPALTKQTAYDFAVVIKPHLDPSISEVSNTDIRALNTLMNMMIDSIIGQTKEQIILSREIGPMGIYHDGDMDNSPAYDLVNDFRIIDSFILADVPPVGSYKNTYLEEMTGLIGKSGISGTWKAIPSGISRDIAMALGIPSSSGIQVAAGTAGCQGGVCNKHSVKSIMNSDSDSSSSGSGRDSVQKTYRDGYKFMKEYAMNRTNFCITAPSINFFQSNFGQDANLGNMLSQGAYTFQVVPELIKGFMNRESRTRESEDKQIDASITRAFKKRGMKPEKTLDVLTAGMERAINDTTRGNTDDNVGVIDTAYALDRGSAEYEQYLKYLGKGMEGAFLKEHDLGSMEIIEKAMGEMASRARFMNNFSQTLLTATEYLGNKPQCPTS